MSGKSNGFALWPRHPFWQAVALLVIAYLAFSLPAVAAGFATTSVGLHVTTVVYTVGVAALGVIALAAQRRRTTMSS